MSWHFECGPFAAGLRVWYVNMNLRNTTDLFVAICRFRGKHYGVEIQWSRWHDRRELTWGLHYGHGHRAYALAGPLRRIA